MILMEKILNEIEFNSQKDVDFKPGIYNMLESFFYNTTNSNLCSLKEYKLFFPFYEKIAGY